MDADWVRDEVLLVTWRSSPGQRRRVEQEMYQRHVDPALRFFRRRAPDLAADLTQTTFMRFFEALPRIENGRALRRFILQIAYNIWREHLREEQRMPVDSWPESFARSTALSSFIARKEDHRIFVMALRKLSLDEQVLLEWVYIEQIPQGEVAAALDCPASTLASRLHRLRLRLAREVEQLLASNELIHDSVGGLETWARALGRPWPGLVG